MFWTAGMDPLVHAVMWSLLLNAAVFCSVSMLSFPRPVERLQGAQFVNVFDHSQRPGNWTGGLGQSEDLLVMSQRIMGAAEAQEMFARAARRQGLSGLSARAIAGVSRISRAASLRVGRGCHRTCDGQPDCRASDSVGRGSAGGRRRDRADHEYSSRLEAKSAELARTARQLRVANEKLTQLSVQKDGFLGQVSHELRTPMTSIRAFSEILLGGGLTTAKQAKYASIIHGESLRLTRLLDDLLDLSVLESGQVVLNMQNATLGEVLDRAIAGAMGGAPGGLEIRRDPAGETAMLHTDIDRLAQVFINLIANASKYCAADSPALEIRVERNPDGLNVDLIDNGTVSLSRTRR